MISPVKGSELAEQIELARQDLESWPQWLKDAARIGVEESIGADAAERTLRGWPKLSAADFID